MALSSALADVRGAAERNTGAEARLNQNRENASHTFTAASSTSATLTGMDMYSQQVGSHPAPSDKI
eukprot:4854245-Prymnesium_polylepis.1